MSSSSTSFSFQHVAPELRLYCGDDSLTALMRELKRNSCQRAVVVCGRSVGSSKPMELLRSIMGSTLAGECISVQSNSPIAAVEETARILSELSADAVIAIGGGSAAVTARAASILLAEKRPAQELCTRRLPSGEFESPRLRAAKLPQFVVPTTPSTAFVKVGSAVHDSHGQRIALFDPKTRAKALFLHPEFLRTASPELVQSASLNTLSTAIEALESPKCDPFSEAMLMHSLRLISQYLHRLSADDVRARECLAVAAVLCGRGTEQSGGGLASVLAHAIGHRSNAANGLVNAIVLPHTVRFNAPEIAHSSARIVEGLGAAVGAGRLSLVEPAQIIAVVDALLAKLPVPRRLRDIGVAQEDLGPIAQAAMSDWFISRNPRRVSSERDVLAILEAAW